MSYAQRRLLTETCLACNREHGQPMCDLCADLEQVEETASERIESEPVDSERA